MTLLLSYVLPILWVALVASTDLSSTIYSNDFTFTSTNSPYYVKSDVVFASTSKVQIENGVEIIFTGNYDISINGNIDCGCYDINTDIINEPGLANTNQFIYFHGDASNPYVQGGILITNTSNSRFCNTKFSNFWNGAIIADSPQNLPTYVDLYIDNCEFEEVGRAYIVTVNDGTINVTDNIFDNYAYNIAVGLMIKYEIYAQGGSNANILFENNVCKNSRSNYNFLSFTGHGIGIVNIKNNKFISIKGGGIVSVSFSGGNGYVSYHNNLFENNEISDDDALIVSYDSNISLTLNTFTYNKLGQSSHIQFYRTKQIMMNREMKYNTFYYNNSDNQSDIQYISDYCSNNPSSNDCINIEVWQSDFQFNNFYNISQIAYIYYMRFAVGNINAQRNYYGDSVVDVNINIILSKIFDVCNENKIIYTKGKVIFWPYYNKPIDFDNVNYTDNSTLCTLVEDQCNYNVGSSICDQHGTTTPTSTMITTQIATETTETTETGTTATGTTETATTTTATVSTTATATTVSMTSTKSQSTISSSSSSSPSTTNTQSVSSTVLNPSDSASYNILNCIFMVFMVNIFF